ncbi:Cysteine methyltransferase OS=Rhizobacter sp. Root404 OX=1736528 GN=ASC76_21455 PE=4 SV=1 [Rhizobacter fulvus]|jgi:methylated-DNA-[protein]-cysteine S-methyltransferase
MTDHHRAMTAIAFTLFDTPVGTCALVWGEHGIVGTALPEASDAATRARVQRRFGALPDAAPPAELQAVIARVQALLHGAPDDLADIALDLRGVPAFDTRVYAYARGIPPGQTRSYGEVAAALGEAAPMARAVGQALGANPFPIIVPCHRVLAAGRRAGGFSAPGGTRTKLRLLEIEGARLGGTPGLFDR